MQFKQKELLETNILQRTSSPVTKDN